MSVTPTFEARPTGLLNGAGKRFRVVRALAAACAVGAFLAAMAPAGHAQSSSTRSSAARAKVPFTSPEAAYEQGRSALKFGNLENAIQAFEFAAENDVILAQFWLARLYADNTTPFTNHVRAFDLYQQIVTEHADVDVDDDPRAPIVAKSMVALAGYYRRGLREAGVTADLDQAANLLRNAAKTFRDEDGQYEYAKILLTGDGLPESPREAVYWLRGLATRGHTAAQAFLADLYWRGHYVPQDQTQALALITLAAEYASAADRVWIEDKYQNMFCGAGEGVRRQAQGVVADWRSQYARQRAELPTRDGLTPIVPRALRTCSNGEPAMPQRRGDITADGALGQSSGSGSGLRPAAPSLGTSLVPSEGAFMQGNALGFAPAR